MLFQLECGITELDWHSNTGAGSLIDFGELTPPAPESEVVLGSDFQLLRKMQFCTEVISEFGENRALEHISY
jgi:hypothetical protein